MTDLDSAAGAGDHQRPGGLLETVEIATGPAPSAAVIWLHGLGADGHDFEPLVPELAWPGAPDIRYVFPHAPVRPVTINAGMAMRAWYDIVSLTAGRDHDQRGITDSMAQATALIRRERQRGIEADRIVVAGCTPRLYADEFEDLMHAAGLDPRARIELYELLKVLAQDGTTIFVSSHILSELAELVGYARQGGHQTAAACGALLDLARQLSGARQHGEWTGVGDPALACQRHGHGEQYGCSRRGESRGGWQHGNPLGITTRC